MEALVLAGLVRWNESAFSFLPICVVFWINSCFAENKRTLKKKKKKTERDRETERERDIKQTAY